MRKPFLIIILFTQLGRHSIEHPGKEQGGIEKALKLVLWHSTAADIAVFTFFCANSGTFIMMRFVGWGRSGPIHRWQN
jgi:hypothetical protein